MNSTQNSIPPTREPDREIIKFLKSKKIEDLLEIDVHRLLEDLKNGDACYVSDSEMGPLLFNIAKWINLYQEHEYIKVSDMDCDRKDIKEVIFCAFLIIFNIFTARYPREYPYTIGLINPILEHWSINLDNIRGSTVLEVKKKQDILLKIRENINELQKFNT